MQRCCFVTLVVISLVLIALGIFVLAWLPHYIKSQVKERMSLRDPTTQLYNNFVNQSNKVSIYKKFVFFNVTNVNAVVNKGAIPEVSLCGPYYYRRIRYRAESEIWWQPNGTMQYKWNETYVFEKDLSASDAFSDKITTARLGVLFAFQELHSTNLEHLKFILDIAAPNITNGIFITKTVDQLVRGYDEPWLKNHLGQDPLVAIARSYSMDQIPHSEIYDGAKESASVVAEHGALPTMDLGTFTKYRGMRNLSKYWSTPETEKLRGTDGSMYPPLSMGDEDEVTSFVEPLRRPVVLKYVPEPGGSTREIDGIPVRRYEPRPDQFQDMTQNPKNKGFHIYVEGWQPKKLSNGVKWKDIYGCITKKFYLDCNTSGDGSWENPGVKVKMPRVPNRDTDESHLEFEPHTGTLFRVRKRSMLSARIQPMPYANGMEHVTGTVLLTPTWLPVMTEDEEMDLPQSMRDQIKSEILWPLRLATPIGSVLVTLGALTLAVTLYFRCRKQSKVEEANDSSYLHDDAE